MRRSDIRNIVIVAHVDHGKTTLVDCLLRQSGHFRETELKGEQILDTNDLERERGITIGSAVTFFKWDDSSINLIDTPGHVDFTAEVDRSLRILAGAILAVDSVAGAQAQTETVNRQMNKYGVARLAFVNKMDRTGASYERTIESIRRRLNGNPVPVQLPIGAEEQFGGMIDLITGKATMYPIGRVNEGIADQPDEVDMPTEYQEKFEEYRQAMIEKIVETDEGLLLQYLEGEAIAAPDLRRALRQATLDQKVVPVLCGSAMFAKGVHNLLDAITEYLPSPADVPAVEGVNPSTDEVEIRNPDASEPLAALAFKVATDPYVGRLVFLRVYSGTVKAGAQVNNVTKNGRERMGRLLRMHANSREELEEVTAGNICAAIGLKNTFTGDTIGMHNGAVILEPPRFPKPVVSVAVEPNTKADQDRLTDALRKLADEDPTFLVEVNEETAHTIISGMGELHLEVLVDRMRREINVVAHVGMPRVSYRETLTTPRQVEGRFVRQTGGHGQFGHVILDIEPLDRGEGIVFENNITRGAIPREFIPAVEKGVMDALDNGPLAGYPLVDLKVSLVDGSFHQVDSSELAFRSAGMLAIREGAGKCAPVLLEPIADLEVVTPGEYLGDVIGDLGTRRAQIQSIEGQDDLQSVRALLPLGETFSYTTALRSLSQGRASYSMEFKYYEPVPEHIVKTLVTV